MHRGREGHTGAVLRCPLRSQPRSAWDFGPEGVFVTHTFVPVFIELQCSQLNSHHCNKKKIQERRTCRVVSLRCALKIKTGHGGEQTHRCGGHPAGCPGWGGGIGESNSTEN